MSAWDRATGETTRAFSHFVTFRDLGPGRTIARAAQIQGVSVHTLEALSARWGWLERTDQFDAHLQAVHDRALQTEAARQGRRRAQAFTALLDRCLEALEAVDLEAQKLTLPAIAAAMKVAADGLRVEEAVAERHVSQDVQDARVALARLPAEIRQGLLHLLDDYGESGGGAGDRRALPAGTGGDGASER